MFETCHPTRSEITFESFTTLTAMAGVTSRVRLGHMVVCTGFRNPPWSRNCFHAGRGERRTLRARIGGGWKEDEWLAYGYGFPPSATGSGPYVTRSR